MVVDEVCNVQELLILFLCIYMPLHDRSRHYAYAALLSEILILLQVKLPLVTQWQKLLVFRKPIGEVVFGEYNEFCALSGS